MRHALSFRGEDHTIPVGYGRCIRCNALLEMEAWLGQTCPGGAIDRNDLADTLAEMRATRGEPDGND